MQRKATAIYGSKLVIIREYEDGRWTLSTPSFGGREFPIEPYTADLWKVPGKASYTFVARSDLVYTDPDYLPGGVCVVKSVVSVETEVEDY